MKDLKNKELRLKCLVKGYEGTYFEIGQVWLTAQGSEKVKIIQLNVDTTVLVEGKIRYSVQLNGKFNKSGLESERDLVKLILTEKTSKKYMVFVEGKNTPRYIHETKESAETEAIRLSMESVGLKVSIVEVIREFKSKIIIEEAK